MIKAIHLDDRLIHGQVAISWTRSLGVDVLLVINDQIVNDQMRRNALKLGVPAGVKFGFRSVEEGIRFLNKIMALVNNAPDAEKVCLGVPGIKRLTIGGIRKDAPYIRDNLNLDSEDVRALKNLMEHGFEVGVLPTPSDHFVDLKPVLENF